MPNFSLLLLYNIPVIPDVSGSIMKFTGFVQCCLIMFIVGVMLYTLWKAFSRGK